MLEATSVKVYMPDGEVIEYKSATTPKLRVKIEGTMLKVDNGTLVDEYNGIPFRIVWKKTTEGPAW